MKIVSCQNIPAMQSLVSEQFSEFSAPVAITQQDIDAFAALSGDHYWLHTDPDRCRRESPFGTTIAHGLLIQAIQSRFTLPLDYQIEGYVSLRNYGCDKTRFVKPVPVGSELCMRARIAKVDTHNQGTLVTFDMHMHIKGDASPCFIQQLLTLYCF
ncbi:MAG: hypothetical protein RL336_1962 [Pseudomonadota bacterium]